MARFRYYWEIYRCCGAGNLTDALLTHCRATSRAWDWYWRRRRTAE